MCRYRTACFHLVKFAYVTTPQSPWDFFLEKIGRWKDREEIFVHKDIIVAKACTTRIPLKVIMIIIYWEEAKVR